MSIFVFGNFPDSYIEGSGLTPFKVTSEYIICFILLCSLIILYTKKDRFEERVFKLLAASIVATIFGELAFTLYTNVTDFSNLIGHFLKVLSFYFIYQAVIRTGFDDPYTLLFRELKQSEEALRQEATFLRDDKGRIYNILGVKRDESESEHAVTGFQIKEKDRRSLVQNFHGLVELNLDQNFEPVSINGAV